MKDIADATSDASDLPRPPHPASADEPALAELEALFWSAAAVPAEPPPTVVERMLKSWSRAQLEAAIRLYEARLGTAAERPYDLELVRAVAHRRNNLMLTERLREIERGRR